MENKINITTVQYIDKPSFNDWMKEFKVSSQYKAPTTIDRHVFDVQKFKQILKTKNFLN